MSAPDEREREDAPWLALRDVGGPPLGAKARVRRRIEDVLDTPPRRRLRAPIVLVGAAALAVAAIAGGRAWRASGERPHAAAASAPTPTPTPLALLPGERTEVALADGHVSVLGPAAAIVEERRVVLRSGTVDALGRVDVVGPSCEAHVDGTAQVSVADAQLIVRVFAGTAEVVPTVASCRVIELPPPAPPAPAPAPAPVPPPAPTRVARPRPRPPSPLAEEVAAYRDAQRLDRLDPIAALAAWRAAQTRWPDGALAHEVDLHVIGTLVRLGRGDEARFEARTFLRRHPDSPRAGEVRRLLDAPVAP